MLEKLLKYDLKWIYKVVIVFYILAFIFSVIGRCLLSIENSLIFNILSQISFGFAISMMVSSLINNLMRMWVRFVRNIYKDESYLTHTLPIDKKTIYLSKFLAAIITMFTTVLVILFCLAICYYSRENLDSLKSMLQVAATAYDSTVVSLLLTVFIVFFLEMTFILLAGYTAIILGHKSNNNKMLKSIIYGFILYIVPQIITLGIIYILGIFEPNIMNLFNTVGIVDAGTVKTVMYAGVIIYMIYIAIYYIIGRKQFENGVNVD